MSFEVYKLHFGGWHLHVLNAAGKAAIKLLIPFFEFAVEFFRIYQVDKIPAADGLLPGAFASATGL